MTNNNTSTTMTLEQVKALLSQMDELAGFLFENDLTYQGNKLLGAIEAIDGALENNNVFGE